MRGRHVHRPTASERLWERAQRHLPGGVTASARIHAALGRPFLAERALRRPGLGRRRPRVHRPQHVVRGVAAGSRPPGRRRGGRSGRPSSGSCAATRPMPRPVSPSGSREVIPSPSWSASRVRHRDDVARPPDRAGRHRPHEGGQVRGPLPRLQRLARLQLLAERRGGRAGRSSPRAVPESAGMPAANAELTIVLPWNDAAALEAVFAAHGPEHRGRRDGAGQPRFGDASCPPGYLEAARDADHAGTAPCSSSMRSCPGSGPASVAPRRYTASRPDMTTLGKTLGGGTAPVRVRRQPRRDVGGGAARPGGPQRHVQRAPHPVMAGLAFLDQATDADVLPAPRPSSRASSTPSSRRSSTAPASRSLVQSRGRASACCSGSTAPRVRYRDILAADIGRGKPLLRPGARGRRLLPRRLAPRLQRRCTRRDDLAPRRWSGSSVAARRLAATRAEPGGCAAGDAGDPAAASSSVASSTSSTASRSGSLARRHRAARATTPRAPTSSPRRGASARSSPRSARSPSARVIDLVPTVHFHALFAGGPIEHDHLPALQGAHRRCGEPEPRAADRDHAAAPRRDGHDRGGRPGGRPPGDAARDRRARRADRRDVRHACPRHGPDGARGRRAGRLQDPAAYRPLRDRDARRWTSCIGAMRGEIRPVDDAPQDPDADLGRAAGHDQVAEPGADGRDARDGAASRRPGRLDLPDTAVDGSARGRVVGRGGDRRPAGTRAAGRADELGPTRVGRPRRVPRPQALDRRGARPRGVERAAADRRRRRLQFDERRRAMATGPSSWPRSWLGRNRSRQR